MLRLRTWANGVLGNTPLEADRLNGLEDDLGALLLQFGATPAALFSGAVTLSNGAPVSASVKWPDGTVGVYSGTESTEFPGAIDGYTITYAGIPTLTVTQPGVTRDAEGYVTNSPALTIS